MPAAGFYNCHLLNHTNACRMRPGIFLQAITQRSTFMTQGQGIDHTSRITITRDIAKNFMKYYSDKTVNTNMEAEKNEPKPYSKVVVLFA
jgi:hypothetical protein